MTRPTKLTPEVSVRILKALRSGNSIEVACRIAGIHPSSFYNWQQRAKRGDSPFREFFNNVTRANAMAEKKLLSLVLDSAQSDWRAAGWFLERRFSERWANQGRVDVLVEKQLEEITNALQNKLSPEIYETVIRALS